MLYDSPLAEFDKDDKDVLSTALFASKYDISELPVTSTAYILSTVLHSPLLAELCFHAVFLYVS